MDTIISFESSSAQAEWRENMKRNITVKPAPKNDDDDRRVTDKNSRTGFFIIVIAWIVCWHYAVVNRQTDPDILSDDNRGYNTIFDNGAVAKDVSEFLHHEIDNTTNFYKNTTTEEKILDPTELLFLLFDAGTCNLSNLDEYLKKNNMVAGIYLIISTLVLMLSFSFIESDKKMFSKQPAIFGAVFLFIALIEHLSKLYSSSDSFVSSALYWHEKLLYWVIPETVVLMIWLSKMSSAVHHKNPEDFCDVKSILQTVDDDDFIEEDVAISYDNECADNVADSGSSDESDDDISDTGSSNADSGNSTDDESADASSNDQPVDRAADNNVTNDASEKSPGNDRAKDDYGFRIIPSHYYVYAFAFGFPFLVVLKLLMMLTMIALYQADWHRFYTYVIAGGSLYIGLTLHHYGLMLTACATNMLIDNEKFSLNDLRRAVYIVSRYHFGTACCISSGGSIVLMESEFKADDRVISKFFRHTDLSRVIAATRGYDYTKSLEELLRIVSTAIRMQDYVIDLGSMTGFLLKFVLPINSFMIIFLWDHGVYDAHFAKASWVMYLTITFTFYFVMQYIKTAADTVALRLCEKQMIKKGRSGEV